MCGRPVQIARHMNIMNLKPFLSFPYVGTLDKYMHGTTAVNDTSNLSVICEKDNNLMITLYILSNSTILPLVTITYM